MLSMGWLTFAAAICLVAAATGDDSVGVSMCCPEGRLLKLVPATNIKPWLGDRRRQSRTQYVPKCVRSRRGQKDTLDGGAITVTDEDQKLEEVVVKKTGLMLPSCPLALRVQLVSLNMSSFETPSMNSSNESDVYKRVRLGDYQCGQSSCKKGNVYVDDKPVCDDDWDDDDAQVVCRELGFTEGGYATKESYFGSVDLENQSGFDQVRCSGRESSLLDCRHETFDDCGNGEGAGVVCYGEDAGGYGSGYGNYSSRNSYNSYNSYDSYGNRYDQEEASDSITLTSTGQLTMPSEWRDLSPSTYKAGEFCMAGSWEGGPSAGVGELQALALACEPCQSEVFCSAVRELFHGTTRGPEPEIVASDREFGSKSLVRIADKNEDDAVNFDEFKAAAEDYVGKVFNFLDSDEDGNLDEDVSVKSLSAKLFLKALDETYLFLDVNQDDILSVDDAPAGTWRDRNDDGKISLREVFRVSLINLPAPLYRLYATLDRDKNEKISFEEATNFIKGTLYVIDQNEDCSISTEEIIATLKESKLPSEYQLAMKLLGDYYITLADYCLRQVVKAADLDGDKKTSLAEIVGMKDPDVFYSILKVAEKMGEPHRRTSEFLIGEGRHSSWEQREAVQEMWLNVLYDFVDNRKYDSVPDNFCQLE